MGSEAGRLIVSVHDVAPQVAGELAWLLEALDGIGARPRVLKVVPDQDGCGDLRQSPDLVDRLRREVAAGSEIVVHGCTHRALGRLRGSWLDRARAALFAPGAAEFLALTPDEMRERLDRARAILRDLRLHAQGFCAPAWLAAPGLVPLLRAQGFRYYVSMAGLHDLATGKRLSTPWLGYMGVGPFPERLIALGGGLVRAAAPGRLMKVFLHPQGAPKARACRQVLRQLERLLRDRTPVTYGQLLTA